MSKYIEIKIYVVLYASKLTPCLSFSINGLQIENDYNLNFLGLTINCHLDWEPHLNSIEIKIARVIGLLRKLKYTFPTQVVRSIKCIAPFVSSHHQETLHNTPIFKLMMML